MGLGLPGTMTSAVSNLLRRGEGPHAVQSKAYSSRRGLIELGNKSARLRIPCLCNLSCIGVLFVTEFGSGVVICNSVPPVYNEGCRDL